MVDIESIQEGSSLSIDIFRRTTIRDMIARQDAEKKRLATEEATKELLKKSKSEKAKATRIAKRKSS